MPFCCDRYVSIHNADGSQRQPDRRYEHDIAGVGDKRCCYRYRNGLAVRPIVPAHAAFRTPVGWWAADEQLKRRTRPAEVPHVRSRQREAGRVHPPIRCPPLHRRAHPGRCRIAIGEQIQTVSVDAMHVDELLDERKPDRSLPHTVPTRGHSERHRPSAFSYVTDAKLLVT